jgi:hypothetical protein
MYWVPLIIPGGKPVMDFPGYMPTFPERTVRPVLVIVVAAKAAKEPAVPRETWAAPRDVRVSPYANSDKGCMVRRGWKKDRKGFQV